MRILGHVTPATPTYRSFYGPSVLYVCTRFEADNSLNSNVIRGPKISKFGQVTKATPIYGSIYIPYAGGFRPPSLYQIWSGLLNSFKSY